MMNLINTACWDKQLGKLIFAESLGSKEIFDKYNIKNNGHNVDTYY